MKQKIFLSIAILSLLSLAVFVSASMTKQGNGPYDVEIQLYEGWNVIAGTMPEEGISADSEIQASNIKAMWYYNPQSKEYIRVHPNPELSKLQQADDDVVLTSSMWVYSDKTGKMKYTTLEDYPQLENRELSAGYNFVTITPDMFYQKDNQEVFSWDGVKGNCYLQNVYAWNPEEQGWMPIATDLESFDFNDFLGYGMIVKVTNGCHLGFSSGNIAQPPQIPNNDGDSSGIPSTLGNYNHVDTTTDDEDCNPEGTWCSETTRLTYRDDVNDKIVFVHLVEITQGTKAWIKEYYANAMGGTLETIFVDSNKLYRLENHELFWFIDAEEPEMILTQEGTIITEADGETYSYGTANGNNAVTKYWLSKYPSTEVD